MLREWEGNPIEAIRAADLSSILSTNQNSFKLEYENVLADLVNGGNAVKSRAFGIVDAINTKTENGNEVEFNPDLLGTEDHFYNTLDQVTNELTSLDEERVKLEKERDGIIEKMGKATSENGLRSLRAKLLAVNGKIVSVNDSKKEQNNILNRADMIRSNKLSVDSKIAYAKRMQEMREATRAFGYSNNGIIFKQ